MWSIFTRENGLWKQINIYTRYEINIIDYIDMLKNQRKNKENWFKIYNLTKTMISLSIYILELRKTSKIKISINGLKSKRDTAEENI